MIRTTFIRRWGAAIGRIARNHARDRLHTRDPVGLASESGFTLIEVLMSALMVGFIAIATATGFSSADREAASERFHNEAAVLAAQSQEALRTDSATALNELQASEGHTYTQTVANEKYTITQTAKWVQDSSNAVACKSNAKETGGKQNVSYIKITSSVTWAQKPAAESPVAQSSIITPPDGSSLEVEVANAASEPVAGVTAIANNISLVTGEAGCVIFGDIPSTVASLEVYKIDDVTPSGAWRKVSKELVITPNITTHYPVTLAPGGRITAEFEHSGTPAEGDTFVVANNQMGEAPEFEVGANKFNFSAPAGEEGDYEALTSIYKNSATTPTYTRYPNGNLFPFESAKWTVYAGDCTANNPKTYGVSPGETLVKGGPEATIVKVPTSYVTLAVYTGSFANPATRLTTGAEPYEIVIKNTACASAKTPDNAYGTDLLHAQKAKEGELEHPFQPFGEAEIFLYSKAKNKTYRLKYTNTTEAGSTASIYLGEYEAKEKREEEAAKEAEQRKAAEAKEKEKQTTRSGEAATEKTTKTTDEAAEKTKQTTRKTEETNETSTREGDEKNEKTKQTTRKTEETNEKSTKEADEKNEKTKQEKRVKEEKEAKEAREKLEGEITATKNKGQKESKEKELTKLIKEQKEKQEKREKEATKETEERKTREALEKTKQETREKEAAKEPEERKAREALEKTKQEAREKEAAQETEERKTREALEKTKQETRKKEEEEEANERKAREAIEKTKQETRKKEEEKEAEEGKSEEKAESGDTLE